MELRTHLDGAEPLTAALARAPEIVAEELHRYAWAALLHLEGEVKDRTPAAHGLLRASIVGRPGSALGALKTGVLGIVGTSVSYAVPVELGTRPHFPPIEPLEDWVRVRLGLTGRAARTAAFAIARKIAARGTRGHFMFRDALNDNLPELRRQYEATGARILARIGD